MDELAQYDPDGEMQRYLHFPQHPLDPLSSPPSLFQQVESFLPSPPPLPNNNFDLTSYQIPAPLQENVSSLKVNIFGSLIRELGALTSDCREWCINPLGEMVSRYRAVEVYLEIYGSHGIFQHAFIYFQNVHQGSSPQTELKIYTDLRDKNYEWMKNFVDKYRMLMENYEGILMKDTLSNLIMGSAVESSSLRESNLPLVPDFGGLSQLGAGHTTGTFPGTETEGSGGRNRLKKVGLLSQRKQTKNIRLEDLVHHFHLPRERAAEELNMSVTTLKKV